MDQVVLPVVRVLAALAAVLALTTAVAAQDEHHAPARDLMIATIRNTAATSGIHEARNLSPAVLNALREVPRHQFVPEPLRDRAYEDRPLSIGHGQTISQPFVVALMTDLLKLQPNYVVLEVGTGSGYQAAVLSRLVRQVYTIEIVEPLAQASSERLKALGYGNVTVRHGDGYAGWPEQAPFDAIIVTAGAKRIPKPLMAQLKPGGRMVIPIGSGDQQLEVLEKRMDRTIRRRSVLPVMFVPFTRDPGAN